MRRHTSPFIMLITGFLGAGAVGAVATATGCGSSGSAVAGNPDATAEAGATASGGSSSTGGSSSGRAASSTRGSGATSTGRAGGPDGGSGAEGGAGSSTGSASGSTSTGARDGGAADTGPKPCSASVAGMNPSSFPSGCCAKGPAACVPTADVPASLQSDFSTCSGGLCVPDEIISAGSAFAAQACTASVGGAGVCLSVCIPLIGTSPDLSLLTQGTCITGDVCVPCVNPLTGAATGACSLTVKTCSDAGADSGATADAGDGGGGGVTCPYTGPPLVNPDAFPACAPACNGAHCVPAALVPPADATQLASCTATGGGAGYCAPDTLVESGGEGLPPTCTSVAGAEGRCLSTCLPAVSAEAYLLPVATCAAGEVCVPCYNPTSADPTAPTGACSLACDMPKDPPTILSCPYTGPEIIDPGLFAQCSPSCAGSHCVPASLIPASDASQLASCTPATGGSGYCAPDTLTAYAGEAVPPTCVSIAGAEGRCLSTCLPAVAAEAYLLPVATCASNEVCVPCYNPTSSDPTAATGACSLGCDKPADPPTLLSCPYTGPAIINPDIFSACAPACAGAHCVPASLIPSAEQSLLTACTADLGGAGFCAPDSLTSTAGEGVPPTCVSVAGAEGRCLSTCLPEIAAEAAILPVSTCSSGEVCAPCYNPTASDPTAPTGACSLACDMPADPPTVLTCPWTGPDVINPDVLSPCTPACGGAHCLPAAYVPAAEQSELAACTDGSGDPGFCAPDPIIEAGGDFVPPTCDPWPGSGAEGRCLSTCLPSVSAESATLQQSSCAAGQLCAPCYDPFTGAPTSACTLSCDSPKQAPYTFPTCCNNGAGATVGTCLPSVLVPSSEASSLDYSGNGNSDPCPQGSPDYLCTPDEYLPAPYNTLSIQFCQATFLNDCGVCVSQCVNFTGEDELGTSDCPPNDVAVPCGIAGDFSTAPPGCYGTGGFCNSGTACGASCYTDGDCASPCPHCDQTNGGICDNTDD